MKIILILLSLSFCQTNRNCSLKSFFPSELNCSKYEVIKVVGLKDNYKKISEREEYFDFEYLIEQNFSAVVGAREPLYHTCRGVVSDLPIK